MCASLPGMRNSLGYTRSRVNPYTRYVRTRYDGYVTRRTGYVLAWSRSRYDARVMPRVRHYPYVYEKSLYKRVKCKNVKCKSVKLTSVLSPARELKPWTTASNPPLPMLQSSPLAQQHEPIPCPSSRSSTLSRIILISTRCIMTTWARNFDW